MSDDTWLFEARDIWDVERHQGIGRCLLQFYLGKYERTHNRYHKRAVTHVFQELRDLPNKDYNTTQIILAIQMNCPEIAN